ncbi:hypothetical protein M406DRAFT_37932 [Cryphonectria parasitica EP155]|uniref:Zn(2)-C6 fungal-type domain-containing protein n=1 Tax=Cryphonectria parasitica (strain ATCC 38755 / EP155) TaxID=660469 RepID=A0A9P5CPT2_CRYP1|nr:uncharacterized protein M406DRAFT_37932 [Cryphonectria parasitica EP155]KAF3765305.1 hypothetical protein M406DRAFT_37932 [Cryphonectria parasitica EP155]
MEKRASRACTACRLRKVKCNGQQPCAQCDHLNVACAYSTPTERHGRRVRGRLISQLRVGVSATPPAASAAPPLALPFSSLPLDEVYFTGLIPSYERFAYPVNPIMTSAEILESIHLMREDRTHAAFVYAFAAVTVNLTEVSWTLHGDVSARMQDLGARSLAAMHEEPPIGISSAPTTSVRRIMTCVFLEMCAMACKQHERASLLLQEAISCIHLLRIDRLKPELNAAPTSPSSPGGEVARPELARLQRMYWEAFVHERFLTVVSGYPSTMPPLRTGLPYADPTIPAHIHVGFTRIIRLFTILDDEFLSYWTSQDLPEGERPPMAAQYIERKHTQLDDDETDAATDHAGEACGLTELQRADLFVTRMWQRVLVWQLGMSRCLLSSVPPASSHEAMSLVFPARRLGAQLRSLVTQLDPITSIGMHGTGILQKLFEITNTIADVLALVPDATHPGSGQTVDDFIFLARLLFSFDRIDKVQKDILRMKIQSMGDTFSSIHIEGM